MVEAAINPDRYEASELEMAFKHANIRARVEPRDAVRVREICWASTDRTSQADPPGGKTRTYRFKNSE
jgi:hypothetical protein